MQWILPPKRGVLGINNAAPQRKNAVSAFQITCKLLSFTLEVSCDKLADDYRLSITKNSIYVYTIVNIMTIQPFTMGVD